MWTHSKKLAVVNMSCIATLWSLWSVHDEMCFQGWFGQMSESYGEE